MTITEFLLARIAEDQAIAQGLIAEGPWSEFHGKDMSGPTRDDEYSAIIVGAGRVLAECEAKRRIVEVARYAPEGAGGWGFRRTLRALASVHADHPDFDEAWRQ